MTFLDAVGHAAKKGVIFEDLLTIVEKEGWEYSTGRNYVCSCFVTAFWKAGGIFGNLEIEPNEFSPKDVYQLKIFNSTSVPEVCRNADPDLPYCQVIGKYKMTLPGFNTINLYSHMNERCPSVAPEFVRPEGC